MRLHGRYAEVSHLDALVERGVLRREPRRVLGLFGYHRHFPGEPDLCATVREDFAAAEAAGFPLLRSRQLAALLSAIGLAGDLTGRGREGRSAMKALRRQQWTARAVRQNVKQDEPSGGDSGWGGDGDCGGGGCGGGGD
ncbi:hypothetical protein EES43_17065 [Streptomyces sp. ADI96-02]|uniref:GPP34 family phosphoprotein n=1 Tax=Streptomyces sp. ADI96-02 TaxID=1522760 RepID=UPI000FA58DD1|nr:hypothetical protein EES43_17065 [Streptomyces sp. ADI96-02]